MVKKKGLDMYKAGSKAGRSWKQSQKLGAKLGAKLDIKVKVKNKKIVRKKGIGYVRSWKQSW